MKRQKIVIANWKMNLTVPESTIVLEKYLKEIKAEQTEVVVCPSMIDIYSAEKSLAGTDLKVGAQNVHFEDTGAYTGEISPDQLKGFVQYCIVGHSERRSHFGETDKVVAKKAAACVRHGITPIVCVGENLHEHMDGLTKLVVAGQVEASLADLVAKEVAEIVIAYEPIWAIGSGHVDTPKDAAQIIKNIRNLVKVLYGEKVSEAVRIIYGGSVSEKNVSGFLTEEGIDGYLVATASLDPVAFAKIVNTVEKKTASRVIHSRITKRKPNKKAEEKKKPSRKAKK